MCCSFSFTSENCLPYSDQSMTFIRFTSPKTMRFSDAQVTSVASLQTEVCGGVFLQVRSLSYFMLVTFIAPGTVLGIGYTRE